MTVARPRLLVCFVVTLAFGRFCEAGRRPIPVWRRHNFPTRPEPTRWNPGWNPQRSVQSPSDSIVTKMISYCKDDEVDVNPEYCRYGVTNGFCNKLVCLKGPGEQCGGFNDILGQCGDGLQCQCSYCLGCSTITHECSDPVSCDEPSEYIFYD